MSERLPVDGVQLVLEGSKQFITDLGRVNAVWDKTANRFRDTAGQFTKVNQTFDQTGTAAAGTSTGLLSMAGSIGVAAAGLGILVVGVGKAVKALKQLGGALFGLATEAAELQGISLQFGILTQSVDGGAKAMLDSLQAASGGMISARDLMQKFNSAVSLVGDSFGKELPRGLAILTKVSAATGKSMDFLFEKFQRGIARSSPLLLDDLEIQAGLAASTVFTSEMFGKQADKLSEVEKQAGLLEFTLTKLESTFGAFPDTTKTLTAQTAVLEANFKNIGGTLGEFLVPGMATLVEAANKLVGSFSAAISEGGALEPLLISLGAVFSILADGVSFFADQVVVVFENLTGEMSSGIADTLEDALSWGAELVAAFAEGIVSTAATVLVQAMQFISNILSSWLLGASPPKIAPGITQWGISLMESYLQGMTGADFDILKKVQGPLKKILEGPEFADLSKTLAEALAGGDSGRFLEAVGQAGGIFGDAIREMAKANLDLAASVTDVEEAETALAKSRQKILDSQAEVNQATREYNRLLRDGASSDILAAQMAQINASEANLHTSMAQVNTQEKTLSQAKKRQAQLEEEANLQGQLVNQLLLVNDSLTEQEKAKEKAAGKAKGRGAVTPEVTEALGLPTGLDLGGRIGSAIDAMKAKMAAKFKDIFKPLTDAWGEVKEDIGGLGEVWDTFAETVGGAWDKLKEKFTILQDAEDWVTNLLKPENLQALADFFSVTLWGAMKKVWAWMVITFKPLWTSLGGLFTSLLGAAFRKFMEYWEDLLAAIAEVERFVREDFLPWWEKTGGPFFTEFVAGLTSGLDTLEGMIGTIAGWIDSLARAIDNLDVSKLWPFVGQSPSPLAIGLKGINSQLQVLATTRLPALASMSSAMGSALAPMQQLSPVSNTNVTMNMGGNTFNGPTDNAAFDTKVDQSLRRTLLRR